jgi:hypothetical protein
MRVLTIVWLTTLAVFAGLLLHPAVPGILRATLSNPSRLAAAMVEYGAHLAVFFIGTEMALVCLDGGCAPRRRVVLTIAMVLAVLTEVAQQWVPTRGVDVLDAAFNVLGVALAAVAYRRLFRPLDVAAF